MTPPMGGMIPRIAGGTVRGTAGPVHACRDAALSAAGQGGTVSLGRAVRPHAAGRRG